TSLGLLAASGGDRRSAEASLKRAIAVIEDLRALLPSDEFRTAFVSDKLTPYTEMVRLCLESGAARIPEALGYVERARSRALADILRLRRQLGSGTALVEYFSLDGRLLAFVVTDERVEVIRDLASEDEVAGAIDRLRFQINSLRYGATRMQSHLDQLTRRTRHYLGTLYDLLLGEVEARIGTRRLVVVPHRALHYVPFHALHDGESYTIERREFCYAPSAGVLSHCLN